MIDWVAQMVIVVTGPLAVWITQQKNESLKKYACLFGMAAQPFWLYATFTAGQWGIFIVSFVYTYSWWLGIRQHWLDKWKCYLFGGEL